MEILSPEKSKSMAERIAIECEKRDQEIKIVQRHRRSGLAAGLSMMAAVAALSSPIYVGYDHAWQEKKTEPKTSRAERRAKVKAARKAAKKNRK